jgi:hypothetical protein
LIKTITHAGVYEKIAQSSNANEINILKEKIFYSNMARMILIGLFLFISALVYVAYKKRIRTKNI